MKRALVSILALVAALSAAPSDAQERTRKQRELAERVAAAFREGEPMGFQLVFEALETDHDLDVNTVVESSRVKESAEGQAFVLATASYEREDGQTYRFVFGALDGGLRLFDLQRREAGEWKGVPQDTFWFQLADDPPPPDFLPDGDVLLTAHGWCNKGRGATERGRAVVVLRSYHSADGRPPAY